MDNEVLYLECMLQKQPKNYQLWNHRRIFAMHRGREHAHEVLIPCSPM